jgi:hypothetical protein
VIEHTIVQPFQGEKADSAIFLRSIATLDQKPEMLLPGFDVDFTMTVGAKRGQMGRSNGSSQELGISEMRRDCE